MAAARRPATGCCADAAPEPSPGARGVVIVALQILARPVEQGESSACRALVVRPDHVRTVEPAIAGGAAKPRHQRRSAIACARWSDLGAPDRRTRARPFTTAIKRPQGVTVG